LGKFLFIIIRRNIDINIVNAGKKVPPTLADEHGPGGWDESKTCYISIYLGIDIYLFLRRSYLFLFCDIVNSKTYKEIVGQFIPRPPIDKASEYSNSIENSMQINIETFRSLGYQLENIEWSPECEEKEINHKNDANQSSNQKESTDEEDSQRQTNKVTFRDNTNNSDETSSQSEKVEQNLDIIYLISRSLSQRSQENIS
jgi:hypothetical protein